MKPIEYLKDISLAEMEKIASDNSVRVPQNLENTLEKLTDSLEAGRRMDRYEKQSSVLIRRTTGIAAAVILLAALSISDREPVLKDTYDDPQIAYAEVEKTLMLISDAINTGIKKSNEAVEAFETPKEIVDNIIR